MTRIGGAVTAVLVANSVAGNDVLGGLAGMTVVSLAAGKVGGDLVNAVGGMVFGKRG